MATRELALVRTALTDLARLLTPSPIVDVPTAQEHLATDFAGWHNLRNDRAPISDWAAAHLDDLCTHAERGLAALTGDTLVHTDIRADNLLISPDGHVTVVDWPWACRGPAWLDTLLLLINVRLYGGAADLFTIDADPADLVGALAGFGGFFADYARRPAPPGLPSLRAFQQAQADVVVAWLRELSR